MKVFTTLSLLFYFEFCYSSELSDKLESEIKKNEQRWKSLINAVVPVIKSSKPKQRGYHEVVLIDMTDGAEIEILLKAIKQDEEIVVNAVLSDTIIDYKQPDFVIVLLHPHNKVCLLKYVQLVGKIRQCSVLFCLFPAGKQKLLFLDSECFSKVKPENYMYKLF